MAASQCVHSKTVEDVCFEYKISEEEGLSNDRVLEQRKKFGYNGKGCVFVYLYYLYVCWIAFSLETMC